MLEKEFGDGPSAGAHTARARLLMEQSPNTQPLVLDTTEIDTYDHRSEDGHPGAGVAIW